MPKKYEYFVALSEQNGAWKKHTFVVLDHPITKEDIIDIETKATVKLSLDSHRFSVRNFILLKVTGTFSYRVTYEIRETLCEPLTQLQVFTLDHRLTAKTYEDDIQLLIDQIRSNLRDRQSCRILYIQEMPDE